MASTAAAPAVRVEDETSVGRSYSGAAQRRSVPGLGALRAAKRERSLRAPPGGAVLESMTMARVHLARATREEVLDYFRNTWALTETLFSSLANDSVFYMVPDSLRRPLIFYFGHPAALYINKGHQAGLVGELRGRERGRPRRRPRRARARAQDCKHERAPRSSRSAPRLSLTLPRCAPPPPVPRRAQTRSTRTSRSSSRQASTR
jgi:hypothetical protein